MGILILVLIVFFAVVGVKHKAVNAEADLPSCVMDGTKAFLIDVKTVISGLSKKKPKEEDKPEAEESSEDESESDAKEEGK